MQTIDWNKEINEAIKNEPTETHYKFLNRNSANIANTVKLNDFKKDYFGFPSDKILFDLVNSFGFYVYKKNWQEAKDILKSIELRSSFLINEISNKLN